ncbi:MAG: glycosyltransferase [Phycisphaerales bacterium]|nr:MAG: glycosyltransferase [Phycisphaerales bacterium]
MLSDSAPTIIHFLHSLEGGGTERTLVSLLHSFDSTSLRHIVVTQREAGSLSAQLPPHVACRPLASNGRSRRLWMKLARVARNSRAFVLHARNTGCWADAVAASMFVPDVRLILGFHGLESPRPFTPRHRLLARWGLWTRARFASVSEAGRIQLIEQGGVPGDRVDVLQNGVDVSRFVGLNSDMRCATRRTWGCDDSSIVIGTIGSLTPVKRYDSLIKAFARAAESLTNTHLVIVGDGPLRPQLAEQAASHALNGRVTFTGPGKDIPALLAGMDVYACSSDSEGMNNAVLEALAAGLPVIATDVGDNARVVRDGIEGRIVPANSCEALTGAMTELTRSASLRSRLASATHSRAGEYDFAQTVRNYERYYGILTNARRTTRTMTKRDVPHRCDRFGPSESPISPDDSPVLPLRTALPE